MSQEQQQQDNSNPLGLDSIPNLRWTFTLCPNSPANKNNGNNGNENTNNISTGASPGANNQKQNAFASVGNSIFKSVTGLGSSGVSATNHDDETNTGSAHPPPVAETVVPLACMYTPMHDHCTSAADDDNGIVYGTLPRIIGPLGKQPPQCKTCKTFLSRHIQVDASTKVWACPCCFTRNSLAPNVFDIWMRQDVENHPIFQYPTVEYLLASPYDDNNNSNNMNNNSPSHSATSTSSTSMTPVFLFLVDICLDSDELEALKTQLVRSLEWLPPDARIGFMTFGHGITLWELGCGDVNRCYSFRGNRRYTVSELGHMLGLPNQQQKMNSNPNNTNNNNNNKTSQNNSSSSFPGRVTDRFLCALSDCEFALNSIIEDVKVDSFPVAHDHRPLRATGAALEIATTLLELVSESHFGKILLFCGGPCTRGPGSVASPERRMLMRGHKDLADAAAPFYDEAVRFYRELEVRMTKTTSSLDAFVYSLDQVGTLELRSCINNTGGLLVTGDKFQNNMFGPSLQRYFERSGFGGGGKEVTARDPTEDSSSSPLADPGYYNGSIIWTRGKCTGFGLEISVNTSPETKIMGALGHCRSAADRSMRTTATDDSKKSAQTAPPNSSGLNNVSSHRVGVAGTNKWLTSCADSSLTLGFVFDTETPVGSSGRKRFVQIVTKYHSPNGEYRARVTTVAMPIIPDNNVNEAASIIQQYSAFDQECAAVVVARMAVSMMEKSDNSRFETIRRWIDKLLVQFCRKFGSYSPGAVDSLRIPQGFSLFPAFMFNFRRSEYFMILNISPDETTFKRHYLMRETCDNCTIMVQPVLYSYSMEEPYATPMPLDTDSIHADNILLLDAFFNVHIMFGVSIEEWINAGYTEQEGYEHFKELLDLPQRDADLILSSRMPYPWFSTTGRFGGDARHFLNRFSAGGSANNNNNNNQGQGKRSGDGATLFTEDASIQRFMHSLKKAVVQPDEK